MRFGVHEEESQSSSGFELMTERSPLGILVVEDNPGDAFLIETYLRSIDRTLEIRKAETLKHAMEQIAACAPLLVLLDMNLPDATGLDGIQALSARFPSHLTIVLTGHNDEELGIRAVQAGAQDFLYKGDLNVDVLKRSMRYSTERFQLTQCLRNSNASLKRLVSIDPLTQLLNRRGLDNTLTVEGSRALRAGTTTAFLLVDCDDFKRINDTYGHATGDTVLRTIAARLSETLRDYDQIARVGGDEFIIVLPETDLVAAERVAQRLCVALQSKPMLYSPEPEFVTVSIGMALSDHKVFSTEEVLALTRVSLRRSKRNGKNRVSAGEHHCTTTCLSPQSQQETLDACVSGEGLSVFKQPIYTLQDHRVSRHELLIRGPQGLNRNPLDLFVFARRHNLTTTLDVQCIRACLSRILLCSGKNYSLNILPSTLIALSEDELLRMFEPVIEEHQLWLELSEQQFIGFPDELVDRVAALRTLGLQLAIDDVGSGRGTLDSVMLLEPEIIKIDKSLVTGALCDARTKRFLQRIVKLAEALDAQAVAEGIETEAHLELAKDLGIPYGQGFLWSRPVPMLAALELAH